MRRCLLFILLFALGLSTPQIARAQTPTLAIADATIVEGNSRTRELLFPVTLSRVLNFDVSASFVTKPITAQPNSDYLPQSAGQIVIKAGATRANILIRVTSDTIEERDEKFLVQLGAPKRCAISDSDGIGSVKDDDYSGQISIANLLVQELNAGQTLARVQVSFSTAPLHDIAVNYETKEDSARVSDRDYVARRGTLIFKPGRRVLSVEVPVVGDTKIESKERFFVQISAGGLALSQSVSQVTLLNDDLDISISPASIIEGSEGTAGASFTVSLSEPTSAGFGLNYQTINGSARSGSDYLTTFKDVQFQTGQKSVNIVIPVVGDTVEEADETFAIRFTASFGFGDGPQYKVTRQITIEDDDTPPPSLSGKIVFSSQREDFEAIYVMNTDGSDQTRITQTTGVNRSPSLSPDGTQIAWESDGEGFLGIYRMNIDGSGELALSPDTGTAKAPNFSRDGSQIVFSFDSDQAGPEDFEIYVMNKDGSDLRRVTDDGIGGPDDTSPSFSPDGQSVAFTTVNNGNTGISVINIDGSNRRNLTQPSIAVDPYFSPDGTRIVFLSFSPDGGQWQLFTMNPDGTGATQITRLDNMLSAGAPCYSPDGRSLAFVLASSSTGRSFDRSQICTINADGSGQVQRTFEGYNAFPSWSIAAPVPTMTAPSSAASATSAGNS